MNKLGTYFDYKRLEFKRSYYSWHNLQDKIECIVGHPFPVYQSSNVIRLLDFILYISGDNLGHIRFAFHGKKLQAIFERKATRHNEISNAFIYTIWLGYKIIRHFAK